MRADNYPDTMSAQRSGAPSPSGKRAAYLFGGFRGSMRLVVAVSVLCALFVLFKDLSHSGRLPEWVAPFASVAFVALIPVGAVVCGLLERRRKTTEAAESGSPWDVRAG